jgi:methyl-accepting chemotaxis protein
MSIIKKIIPYLLVFALGVGLMYWLGSARADSLESIIDELDRQNQQLDGRLEGIRAEISEVGKRIEGIRDEAESVGAGIGSVADEVGSVAAGIGESARILEALEGYLKRTEEIVGRSDP